MSARLLIMALPLFYALTAVGADIGRMFFTPAQRDTLDAARAKNVRSEISNENPQPQPSAAPIPQSVSVNGLVKRSDGSNTVWVNSRPVTNERAEGLSVKPVRNDSRVRLSAPKGRSIDLKVGQKAEMVSGAIEEGYARRITSGAADASPKKQASDNEPVELDDLKRERGPESTK